MGQMAKWTIPDTPSPEAIVKAALERAADEADDTGTLCLAVGAEQKALALSLFSQVIRTLASSPAEVAAIIKKAGERHD
jgi:hypothetical protein